MAPAKRRRWIEPIQLHITRETTMINAARKLIMELAEKHLLLGSVDSMKSSRKPGEIIQALPEDQRTVLRDLKSEDVKDIRYPPWK